MSITIIQNNKENIRLIAAQRYLYSKAKKLRIIRVAGSLFLALIMAPLTIIFFPDFNVGLGILSSIWLVVMFLLNHFESRTTKTAATIQEQFDTTVFGLDWNKFLAGNKVSPEIIVNARGKYKADMSTLNNWYGDLNEIPKTMGILLCQRSNLVWDWRLRRYFGWKIIICLLFLIGLDFTIAYYTKITTKDFILGLFLPSLSAIIIGVHETKEHFEIANGKEKLEGQLTSLLDLIIEEQQTVGIKELRQIQDKIYELRKKVALIPDWWYNMLKGEFENDMQNSLNIYKEKIKNVV